MCSQTLTRLGQRQGSAQKCGRLRRSMADCNAGLTVAVLYLLAAQVPWERSNPRTTAHGIASLASDMGLRPAAKLGSPRFLKVAACAATWSDAGER